MNSEDENHSEDKKYSEIVNNKVTSIINGIRNGNKGWLMGVGMCEWCGSHPAEYNLELNQGSHRECWWCWKE